MAKARRKNHTHSKHEKATFVRNFIFGVEDSLVSTVGLVSGVAAANVDRRTIFVSGIILIVVEALSMGVGSVLSETSTQEFVLKRVRTQGTTIIGGVIMFFSYFAAGFIPLLPYILLDVERAFPTSILASLAFLFILGYISARKFNAPAIRSGTRMLVLGGIAILAGVGIGTWIG